MREYEFSIPELQDLPIGYADMFVVITFIEIVVMAYFPPRGHVLLYGALLFAWTLLGASMVHWRVTEDQRFIE